MNEYLRKRAASFRYAFTGLQELLKSTPNAVIHLIMAIIAIGLGFYFSINTSEWIAIIIVIGLVLSLEAINTSIEGFADLISREHNNDIKRIKDISAGAVLIAALAAFVVGVLIFLPKFFN